MVLSTDTVVPSGALKSAGIENSEPDGTSEPSEFFGDSDVTDSPLVTDTPSYDGSFSSASDGWGAASLTVTVTEVESVVLSG